LTTFSWVASKTVENFDFDASSLIQTLVSKGKLPADTYLGVIGFGTEAFHSTDNVTFTTTKFGASVDGSGSASFVSMALQNQVGWVAIIIGMVHLLAWMA
jgi:xyloglucan-specific endo-beta-1,4-glucanase